MIARVARHMSAPWLNRMYEMERELQELKSSFAAHIVNPDYHDRELVADATAPVDPDADVWASLDAWGDAEHPIAADVTLKLFDSPDVMWEDAEPHWWNEIDHVWTPWDDKPTTREEPMFVYLLHYHEDDETPILYTQDELVEALLAPGDNRTRFTIVKYEVADGEVRWIEESG